MFKPTITEEWLLATMKLEGDGFVNAGGIRESALDGGEDALDTFVPTLSTLKPREGIEEHRLIKTGRSADAF